MLYNTYIKLSKNGSINTGFSQRIPDYATQYWFDALETAIKQTPAHGSFLDIGAGSGRLSLLLAQSGHFTQGTALEVAPDPIAWEAMHRTHPNIRLVTGLLQDTCTQLKTYDFILLSEVFEHIPLPDVPPFLETLKKLLSPNGIIFLTTPNAHVQGPAGQSHMWHERQPYGHHKHYTVHELQALFASYNFDIQNILFEGHTHKVKLYNKLYYPITRWDAKLTNTPKLPRFIRTTYTRCSYPAIWVLKPIFWSLGRIINYIQQKNNNFYNCQTIMLTIKHAKKP